jgi:hypothetical protein
MPALASALRVAGTGPESMITGSSPTLATARIRARGLRPSTSAMAALPMNTAAAPSTMPLELPAWWMCSMCSISGYAPG